ncbi:2-iminobutanoate/2-iminopropanoate deaminase [Variovorax sp. OK212]|jgi:2-iminobutanoate/2-iminopropanoate deaminase|nr:2-iminobutanoate/2-iminopropanoate deaminase [Variovorax sp. OK202]SFD58372.1 2-iminobutanoate/2-iminopropanoate deaminase [Variovorax sp. OK212]
MQKTGKRSIHRLPCMPHASLPVPAAGPHASAAPYFSSARRDGDWVFVSGQMAFDEHSLIAGDTVGEQTRRCLGRIDDILRSEGLGLADVVKTTVWLGRVGDFAEFNCSYAAVFAATQAPAPARSTVRADLMVPGALVEIEAIARNRPPAGD